MGDGTKDMKHQFTGGAGCVEFFLVVSQDIKSSAMLKKLGAYKQQNRLYLALVEIGRVERTIFMLVRMKNPKLRMECQDGLNKRRIPSFAGQGCI
jgi:hypothetical protein